MNSKPPGLREQHWAQVASAQPCGSIFLGMAAPARSFPTTPSAHGANPYLPRYFYSADHDTHSGGCRNKPLAQGTDSAAGAERLSLRSKPQRCRVWEKRLGKTSATYERATLASTTIANPSRGKSAPCFILMMPDVPAMSLCPLENREISQPHERGLLCSFHTKETTSRLCVLVNEGDVHHGKM